MKMNTTKDISYERTTVSIGKIVFDNAKTYAKKNRIKFSNLVEEALDRYLESFVELPTKDQETFFVDLCEMLAGQKVTRRAKKAFETLTIDQRDFMEHVLTRASIAALWLSKHPEANYSGLRFYHASPEASENQSLSSDSNLIVI